MEKVVYPRHLADCRAAQHYFVSMSFFIRSYVQNLKQRPQRLSPSPSCKLFLYPSLSSNSAVSWSRGGLGLDFKPKEIWTILPMPIHGLLAFEKVIKQIKSARGRSTMIIWFARICGTHIMVVGTFCTAFSVAKLCFGRLPTSNFQTKKKLAEVNGIGIEWGSREGKLIGGMLGMAFKFSTMLSLVTHYLLLSTHSCRPNHRRTNCCGHRPEIYHQFCGCLTTPQSTEAH